ncbi:MAG: hypothetical protein R2695_03085 [Acidimicrobiales bacterium]
MRRSPSSRTPSSDHGDAVADFEYDYGAAFVDGGVVRPVFFPRFDGHMEWIGADGTHKEAAFSDELDAEDRSARLRTALSVDGDWLATVLVKADDRLRAIRRQVPDAGGLVIATDQDHACGIAGLLARWTGEQPALAVSDDPRASTVIEEYARDETAWVVAVRMISEGVDIPRLRVAARDHHRHPLVLPPGGRSDRAVDTGPLLAEGVLLRAGRRSAAPSRGHDRRATSPLDRPACGQRRAAGIGARRPDTGGRSGGAALAVPGAVVHRAR